MPLHTGSCCYKCRHQAVLQQSQTPQSSTHPTGDTHQSWPDGETQIIHAHKTFTTRFSIYFSMLKKRPYLNPNKIWRHHSLRKPTNTHPSVSCRSFTKPTKIKIIAFSCGRSTTSQATAPMSSIHCSPSLCITQRNPAVFSVCKQASSLFSAAVTWFTKKGPLSTMAIKYHYNFPPSAYYSRQSIWAYILWDKELTCSITVQTALFFCNK